MITPPDLSLLFIMLCFWAVFFVVSTQLVRPLLRILDQREQQVRGARQDLEASRAQLQQAVAASEHELAAAAIEATRERAALRAEGETSRRARLDAARTLAQQRLSGLATELDEAAAAARAGLKAQTAQLARELASQVLGRSVRG
ncbi:MAG TPA: ATP synthase F0 subunit B [Thermoanaerobaculaceae bacterium]|nr:ATP synthase F0 subunit B [Thermoanaerobaculaceae bacterium]HRS15278.1 ATP synthase F0 subunit B [Thermoanaerobaculaceae bacterium]